MTAGTFFVFFDTFDALSKGVRDFWYPWVLAVPTVGRMRHM